MNYRILLIILTFSCLSACQSKNENNKEDPISKSLKFQSWQDTQQPQGSPAYLGLGAYAKVLCTAVFESGRDPLEAFNNSGQLILDKQYVDAVEYKINFKDKLVELNMGPWTLWWSEWDIVRDLLM